MEATQGSSLQKLEIDILLLKKGALVLRALNHKLRQQILKYLDEKGETTVTELYIKFRLEQSVASQQLAILRQSGFVNTRREGKRIYYSVNHQRLMKVQDVIGQLLKNKG